MADSSLYNEATGYSIAESIQSVRRGRARGREGFDLHAVSRTGCLEPRVTAPGKASNKSTARRISRSVLLYSNDSLRIQRVNMSSETSGWSYGTM